MEHFSSTQFPNAVFPDGILKYAFRAKSAASPEVKMGPNTQRHMQAGGRVFIDLYAVIMFTVH